METPLYQYILFGAGVAVLITGILIFSGITSWGKRSYYLGKAELTHEAVGLIFFFAGIVLMLFLLIPLLSPNFVSPGMAGD